MLQSLRIFDWGTERLQSGEKKKEREAGVSYRINCFIVLATISEEKLSLYPLKICDWVS